MKRSFGLSAVVLIGVAIFGLPSCAPTIDAEAVLSEGYTPFETGVRRQPNGILQVQALTRMPRVKAAMVKWWFTDFLQTTEHYKWWHPTAHVWMDWENKRPGEIVGASHLVHEYIGADLSKLRIQFVPAEEILGSYEERPDRFVLCARVGMLEEPINVTKMCHIVRDTPWGAQMRSHFWLGHVSRRDGDEIVPSVEGVLGNTALVRMLAAPAQLGTDLMIHAVEEMGYLSDLLPDLYAGETGAALAD